MGAMKQIATVLDEHHINAKECEITLTRSTIDGALLVIVDTRENVGRVRIDLNDGTIWDQDPEEDVPAMLDRFTVQPDHADHTTITCKDCGASAGHLLDGSTLRDYVADARAHVCETGETE